MTTDPIAAPAPKRRVTHTPVRELARHAVEALLSKKGLDIQVLDVRGVSGITDYLILATGESELQVRAMVDAVRFDVRDATGEKPWHVEGTDFHQWVVVDYVDLVVHVFQTEKRSFYALERLWGDAPMEAVTDEGSGDTVALLRDDAPDPAPSAAPVTAAADVLGAEDVESPEDSAADSTDDDAETDDSEADDSDEDTSASRAA